jgi:hypothetical protein
MNLTVVCLYVRGPYPYTAEYVTRLEKMVRRYLRRPFRFVCLTDRPHELPTVETIVIASMQGIVPDPTAGIWCKMRVFDSTLGLTEGRNLYLDLDTLVVADLDPIVDFPASLALPEDPFVVERAHITTDRYGRRLVRKFNGSVMVWDGGTHEYLWDDWTPDVAWQLSTDQDWVCMRAWDAEALSLSWFPRISQVQPPWPEDAKVILVKKPKSAIWAEKEPWFEEMWGGWAAQNTSKIGGA